MVSRHLHSSATKAHRPWEEKSPPSVNTAQGQPSFKERKLKNIFREVGVDVPPVKTVEPQHVPNKQPEVHQISETSLQRVACSVGAQQDPAGYPRQRDLSLNSAILPEGGQGTLIQGC